MEPWDSSSDDDEQMRLARDRYGGNPSQQREAITQATGAEGGTADEAGPAQEGQAGSMLQANVIEEFAMLKQWEVEIKVSPCVRPAGCFEHTLSPSRLASLHPLLPSTFIHGPPIFLADTRAHVQPHAHMKMPATP